MGQAGDRHYEMGEDVGTAVGQPGLKAEGADEPCRTDTRRDLA